MKVTMAVISTGSSRMDDFFGFTWLAREISNTSKLGMISIHFSGDVSLAQVR